MSATPNFTAAPNLGANLTAARSSTANTARDGSGTINTIVTGGASGTRVDRINVKATGVTTGGMIRFFLVDASANKRIIHEMSVTAVAAPSATVKTFEDEWVRTDGQPIVEIPAGWFLKWAPHNAEEFDVVPVVSGDF